MDISEINRNYPNEVFCTYRWSPTLEALNCSPIVASIYDAPVNFHLAEGFAEIETKIKAHIRAGQTAKVCDTVCFSDLVPQWDLVQFCRKKSEAVCSFLASNKKPENYDHSFNVQRLLSRISENEVDLDVSKIKSTKQLSLYRSSRDRVIYDAFKTSTGRLTTTRDSFPILTLPAKDREFIVPKNDLFIEFDFNAAEVRTLLALNGHDQPELDIHVWNMALVPTFTDRRRAKEGFFAWLYNPKSKNPHLKDRYNKEVYKSFYSSGTIRTPFNREMKVSEEKALNYLVQSTSSDLTLEQACKVSSLLEGKRSFVKFLLHDSIVLDVDKEDLQLMELLYETFGDTRFGTYVVNVRHGKDFYNLKEMSWKT